MPRRTPIGWCSSPTASSPANSATRRRIGSSSTSSRWGTDVLKLALRGVLAHKVRLAMTALAIVLGVAFVAGTYVFTDSIKASFSDLFDDVNSGVDLYVSGISEFGFSSPLIDEGLVDQLAGVPGVVIAAPSVEGIAQIVAPPPCEKGPDAGNTTPG